MKINSDHRSLVQELKSMVMCRLLETVSLKVLVELSMLELST